MDITLKKNTQPEDKPYSYSDYSTNANSSRFTLKKNLVQDYENKQIIQARKIVCPDLDHLINLDSIINEEINLIRYIREGDIISLMLYLEKKPNKINKPIFIKDQKQTLLHYAIEREQLEIVKYLVTQGADLKINPNLVLSCCQTLKYYFDPENLSPEQTKELRKVLDIMEYLLKNGANPNCYNKNYGKTYTPLIECMSRDSIEAFKLLLSYGADINFPLNDLNIAESLASNNIEYLNLALANGLNIDTIYDNDLQIIHILCLYQKIDHIKLLFNYNVNVNAKANNLGGATSLHYILSTNTEPDTRIAIAKLLILHGADFNIKGNILEHQWVGHYVNHDLINCQNQTLKNYRPTDLITNKIEKSILKEFYLEHKQPEKIDNQQPEKVCITQPKKYTDLTNADNFTESQQYNIQNTNYERAENLSFFKRVEKTADPLQCFAAIGCSVTSRKSKLS